jgi:uncharacterized protein
MIVPFYAAILAVLLMVLSLRIITRRRSLKIAFGDGENRSLQQAIRAHGNFTEYVPISLLLFYFAEQLTNSPFLIHFMCIMLIVGRVSHAYGFSQSKENLNFRVGGMFLTFTSIAIAIFIILISKVL